MGTSLAGNLVAELVVLLRDVPTGEFTTKGYTCPLWVGLGKPVYS